MGFSYLLPQIGQPDTTEDVKVQNALTALSSWGNGNVDTTDVKATFAQSAGINQSGQTVKGTSIIATSESRTNVAYGTLTTPDQVTGVVLPTNGLIQVWYQATVQESVNGAAKIAIFIGANQLKAAPGSGTTPVVQEASISAGTSVNVPISTNATGLVSNFNDAGYTGDVTTGQVVSPGTASAGGPCYIFAAAGTYTVSVQYKASSGSVTAANRKLWVQAISFS